MPVVHVLLVLGLLGAGIAVRTAKDTPILNFVTYAQVTDRPALHRWAGNRLLLTGLAASAVASFAWVRHDLALMLLFVQIALVFVAVVVLAAGSSKFIRRRSARSAA